MAPGVDERIRSLGEPAGVIQLLDRHTRDCGDVLRPVRRAAARGTGRAARTTVRAPPRRPRPLVARGRALVARPSRARVRRRARDDSVLPRRRRAGGRAPDPEAASAAVAPGSRCRASAGRARRGLARRRDGRGCRGRAAVRPTPDPSLAGRRASDRPRRLLGARRVQLSVLSARARARDAHHPPPTRHWVGGRSPQTANAGATNTQIFCANRSPAQRARASRPGRTRRGGAFSPASRTGGFEGSASGAAANDATRRSAGASS